MSAIVKALEKSAVTVPKNARETCSSGAKIGPAGSALSGDTAKNLIDDSRVSHNQNPLTWARVSDGLNRSQHTLSKPVVTLTTGPGKFFVGLSVIPVPKLGVLPLNIVDGQAIEGATIDFGKRFQNPQGTKDWRGRRFCRIETSSQWA
jgi:hypothetical protein